MSLSADKLRVLYQKLGRKSRIKTEGQRQSRLDPEPSQGQGGLKFVSCLAERDKKKLKKMDFYS